MYWARLGGVECGHARVSDSDNGSASGLHGRLGHE